MICVCDSCTVQDQVVELEDIKSLHQSQLPALALKISDFERDILKMKSQHSLSIAGVDSILQLFHRYCGELRPRDVVNRLVPHNFSSIKSKLEQTETTDCLKIHVCPNECVLYRGKLKNKSFCPRCNEARFQEDVNEFHVRVRQLGIRFIFTDDISEKLKRYKPRKVYRYFSIAQRLRAMFSNSAFAKLLRYGDDHSVPERDYVLTDIHEAPIWREHFETHLPRDSCDVRVAFSLPYKKFDLNLRRSNLKFETIFSNLRLISQI